MADRFEFRLGSVEASVVGGSLGVDVRRFPLRVRNTTTDPERLVKLAMRVSAKLEEVGLARRDELNPALRKAFRLFDRHRVSVAITGIDGVGEHLAVLAFTDGSQALQVTQYGQVDDLVFTLFSDDDFADTLATIPPKLAPAPGGTLEVQTRKAADRSAFRRRRDEERAEDEAETDAFGNIEVAGTVRPRGSRRTRSAHEDRLADVLSGPRQGVGQILVTGKGRNGESAQAPALSWLDADQGRYLIQTVSDTADEFAARYVPAGEPDLANAIRTAVATVY